jgi:hypothetical protein
VIDPEVAAGLGPLIDLLDRLGVRWCVGGSVASSIHGIVRSTLDVDLLADLSLDHVQPLVAALEATFYVDAGAVRRAIQSRRAFNLIHLDSMTKIDVFVPGCTFDREELRRAQRTNLGDREAWVVAPEDIVLAKLAWYRRGGGVSDRQWSDVQGVLRTQAGHLDHAHLRHWAAELGVADLLDRALLEAGAS